MRGEWISVWRETWRAIWSPLSRHSEFGDDIFVDIYREFVRPPLSSKRVEDLLPKELAKLQKANREYAGTRPVKAAW